MAAVHEKASGPDGLVGIKLVVDDLEASAAFYKAVFGMVETERIKVDVGIRYPLDEIILSPGAALADKFALILLKYVGKAPPSPSDHILCLAVMDLDEVMAQVQRMGGKVLRAPQTVRTGGSRMAIATDNAGNLMEVVQMPAGQDSAP
ncbi:VOC family protein [Denitratisoma oestradiolicum]|uniref:Uncharacterized protein n=1 Tax=Denitratisoma oestradiolicum TaxID=311182 RepID=A0A6S6Y0G6_9PROT|nr:VOC family protein [Denitratisoma oestradiolicum]TWO81455.1 hypothetical protein CBW56_04925 [Denitratisoma oestradiolicum]CAB1368659.1 conserved protein of unknown function [Denitratisoma oestradiolicum]